MGVDRRGVARGKCKEGDCDCEDYDVGITGDTGTCGYFWHPPARHEKLVEHTSGVACSSREGKIIVFILPHFSF